MTLERPASDVLALRIRTLLEDKKAREVEILDVEEKTTLADRFVLATGTSTTHVKALSDEVQYRLKQDHGLLPLRIEGHATGRWILLDYQDVIVHLFHSEDRAYYSLERLWSRR